MQCAAALLMGGIAAVSLIGWLVDDLGLAGRTGVYPAMVPVTSIVFLALSVTVLLRLRVQKPRARAFVLGIGVAIWSVVALELTDFLGGIHVSPDRLFATAAQMAEGEQVGRMSPVVAVLFAMMASALMLLESSSVSRRSLAAKLAMVVSAVGLTLCVGYAYDAPLMLDLAPYPPAAFASVGVLILGLSIAALGLDRWPFALFLGDTVRAQLMRAVLPVVTFAALAFALLGVADIRFGLSRAAIPTSVVLILAVTAVTAAVLRSASRIGGRVDSAEYERQLAVNELEVQHQNLEALIEARTAELVAANAELREATAAKSDFLASMSHELRTPLNSIIGFSDILNRGMAGDLTDEQARQIGMINRSGKHLLGLINDVLDLAKIEAGKAELHLGPVDVETIVRDVVEIIGPLAGNKGLVVSVEIDGPVPVLDSDADKIRQILLNLAGNAVKFTESGRIAVTVRGPLDGTLGIAVSDTGRGIAEAEIPRIFEAFSQVRTTDSSATVGTGLGLSISREFAHLLGGDIAVKSEPGVGSTFTLVLPAP
ncbi:MAG: hypothetical protein D9V44_08270 [Actinobacteria bacterium]|nr:MAG: hypothetical protein D9V44_08270 [Actinomycetota bacterium]